MSTKEGKTERRGTYVPIESEGEEKKKLKGVRKEGRISDGGIAKGGKSG